MEIKEALQIWSEWYSRNAEVWDARVVPRWEPLYKELVRRANIPAGSKVLDVGTGTGTAALVALRAVGSDGHVIGIDNSEGMLRIAEEKARKLAANNIEFRRMDLSSLDFPEGRFDRVISSFAIYGSFPPGVGLKEAHRVLQKGGKLAFSMYGKPVQESSHIIIYGGIFEKHRTKEPSASLRKMREASAIIGLGFCRYGPLSEPSEPSAVLRFLREVGFQDVEASMTHRRIVFPSIEGFVEDRVAVFSPIEYSEMTEQDRRELMDECLAALRPFLSDEGLVSEVEVIYYTGYK